MNTVRGCSRRCFQRRHVETAMASVFVLVLFVTMIAAGGLALDGSRLMGTRRNLAQLAGASARTGSQWFDEASLNNGALELDAATAIEQVNSVLDQQGIGAADRRVEYLGAGVLRVEVSRDVPMIVLGLIGVPTKRVSASARTELVAQLD